MKFPSRTEIIDRIPNKYDAVVAISKRAQMLMDGKKRLIEENDENFVKLAMTEIATGALEVEITEPEE
ncbi:MAG: DNA-directed RNA polymerase subunit omega [Candidatus Riflebacteria bacterium]|nr:DNA-directed RNA polymerase subunit omega [Candidatus Riflebacteria bacterium]